jgi:mannose-1-phosphate guanylyltransferase
VLVLSAPDLRDACRAECPGARVLAEPLARNTAPAIAAAAGQFVPESSAFAVLPADHAIDDVEAFVQDLVLAFETAERDDVLVTFGIRPSNPDTNFGYIRRGARVAERVHRVAQFTEKPDRARAEAWLATGDYAWNSGIFVWRAAPFFDALATGRPALARALRGFSAGGGADAFEARLARVFPDLEAISVDYAVLEGAPNVVMIEPRFDWDDLGSWNAWARRQPRDARGNVLFGDALAFDFDDCVVVGEGGVAAALGLRDMVVLNANGSTLSCRLDRTDQVRRVNEALRARARA